MTFSAALEAAHLIDRLERLARLGDAPGGINPAQWKALRYRRVWYRRKLEERELEAFNEQAMNVKSRVSIVSPASLKRSGGRGL